MLSTEPPEKGLSTTRKWGVKDHIERSDYQWENQGDTANNNSPLDWETVYLQEKARIEQLAE